MNLDEEAMKELERAFRDLIPSAQTTDPISLEYRLYYAEDGSVIAYTCDKLEGQYIVIDRQTFAEARPDVKVVNGKVVSAISSLIISKLKPNTIGVATHPKDVSIIAGENDTEKTYWKIELHELEPNH